MSVFLFPFLFSYLSLYYRIPLLPDPIEGVLPLLERLFGVKGHDCFLSCLAFRQIRVPHEWIFCVKDGCGTYRVLRITSVDFVCSVGLSRILRQARWRGKVHGRVVRQYYCVG